VSETFYCHFFSSAKLERFAQGGLNYNSDKKMVKDLGFIGSLETCTFI